MCSLEVLECSSTVSDMYICVDSCCPYRTWEYNNTINKAQLLLTGGGASTE